jgi:hypothetical protein
MLYSAVGDSPDAISNSTALSIVQHSLSDQKRVSTVTAACIDPMSSLPAQLQNHCRACMPCSVCSAGPCASAGPCVLSTQCRNTGRSS